MGKKFAHDFKKVSTIFVLTNCVTSTHSLNVEASCRVFPALMNRSKIKLCYATFITITFITKGALKLKRALKIHYSFKNVEALFGPRSLHFMCTYDYGPHSL